MSLLPDHDRCPCCGRKFLYVHGLDPHERVHNATLEVVVPEHGADPLYRECPYCGARWHRHHPGHPRRDEAEPFVTAWPAYGFRPAGQAWGHGVVQVATADVGGGRLEVRRATAPTPPTERPAETVHILGAWNPDGRARSLQENQARHDELRAAIRKAGWSNRPAAVRDEAWRWAECSIAVLGAPEDEVLETARAFGQPALYRWTPGVMSILATDARSHLGFSYAARPEPVRRICPMRAEQGQEQEGHVCRNPGGPWISASIHEAARWGLHRETMLAALGCDVCDGGPADGPAGRAVAVRSHLVPSRYGPSRYT